MLLQLLKGLIAGGWTVRETIYWIWYGIHPQEGLYDDVRGIDGVWRSIEPRNEDGQTAAEYYAEQAQAHYDEVCSETDCAVCEFNHRCVTVKFINPDPPGKGLQAYGYTPSWSDAMGVPSQCEDGCSGCSRKEECEL